MTLTIVSGATPGVEQGAIEAAVNLALRWQGWASEQSILTVAPVYRTGLQPTSATDPGMVRRLNIQGADGALVFSTSMVTAGVAAFCDRWTERMGRAFLHVTLNPALFGGAVWAAVDGSKVDRRVISEDVVAHVQRWLRDLPSGRVYVTGPSADDVPGIQGAVRDALIAILEPFAVDEVRQTTRALSLIEQAHQVATAGKQPTHIAINPANVDAAVSAGLDVQWVDASHGGPTLKPGEFLVTREQHRAAVLRGLAVGPEVLPSTVRDVHAFDGPTDCRGEPLDLGPATRADLAELDAVPEPVDSDAPHRTFSGPLEDLVRRTPPWGRYQRTAPLRHDPHVSADPPEGLDEAQRAQLDASVRQAEREIREAAEEPEPTTDNYGPDGSGGW